MAQFVCGADLVQKKEVVSAVKYPVLLIPVLTRPSTLTFVSFDIIRCNTSLNIVLQWILDSIIVLTQ